GGGAPRHRRPHPAPGGPDPSPPGPPPPRRPEGSPRRPPPDPPSLVAHGGGAVPASVAGPFHQASAPGAAARRERLDGPLRPRAHAVRLRRHGRRREGGGVLLRDPSHPRDPDPADP